MALALFYVDALPEVGEVAVVDGDEGFHAANVRRIRSGEELDLGDGDGTVAHCVVEDVGKGRLTAKVLDRTTVPLPSPSVTVVQALPKSDRSELAIELATEAGADAFVAWQASRCVARWESAAKVDKGLRRWGAVARSAARQSRRPYIPSVSDDEISALSDAGATAVRLGPTVLRTSTAAAVALGALGALTPRWL